MNDVNPMIWNINASLFLAEQDIKALRQLVETLYRRLAAERELNLDLKRQVCDFAERLTGYAKDLPGADTTPNANGTR